MRRKVKSTLSKIISPFFVSWMALILITANGLKVIAAEQTLNPDSLKKVLLNPLPDSSRVTVLFHLAEYYSKLNPATALKYAGEGLAICDQHPETVPLYKKAKLLTITGVIYQMMPDYSKALFYHFQALRILEEENTSKQFNNEIAACYNNIGASYGYLKQYELAKKYFIASLPLSNPKNLGSRYNNLGIIAREQHHLQEAIAYYQKAILMKAEDTYVNIGDVYFELNNLKLAAYYYKKGLALTNADIYYRTNVYYNLGRLYTRTNDFKEAEKYFLKARKIAETTGVNVLCEEIYKGLVQMYEKQKDYEHANVYHKLLHAIRDSVYKETNTRQINEMQARYESDKKDKEINLLNQNWLLAEAKSDKRNGIIISFVLVLIIGTVLARNVVLRQKVKTKLLNEEKVLSELQKIQMEKDNIKLMHENIAARFEILKGKVDPHFLFNCLNVLSAIIIDNPAQAVEYVEHFSGLYRTLLKTSKQTLISLHEEMDFVSKYIYLQKMRFEDHLHIHINITINQHQVFVPPFVLQMMVENAIKHNIITPSENLEINIFTEGKWIVVENNLQKIHHKIFSTLTGQQSIRDSYALITDTKPVFIEKDTTYIVYLPIIESKDLDIIKRKEIA